MCVTPTGLFAIRLAAKAANGSQTVVIIPVFAAIRAAHSRVARILICGAVSACLSISTVSADGAPEVQTAQANGQASAQIIGLLRQAVRQNPDRFDIARQLVLALIKARRFDEAHRETVNLVRRDPNPEARQLYYELLAGIRTLNPTSFTTQFSLAPSTNINSGTYNTRFATLLGIFDIDIASQQMSGFGINTGFSLRTGHPLAAGNELYFEIGGTLNYYDYAPLQSLGASLQFGYSQVGFRYSADINLSIAHAFYYAAPPDSVPDYTRYGAAATLNYDLGPVDQLVANYAWNYSDYTTHDHLDGTASNIGLQWLHTVNSTSRFSLGAYSKTSTPQVEHLAYTGAGLAADYTRIWGNRLTTKFAVGAEIRNYHGVFPAFSHARHDQSYYGGITLSHPNIRVFNRTPSFSCTFRSTISDIALYASEGLSCAISIDFSPQR